MTVPKNWRPARSLDVLLAQWDAAHPGRSKASDGSIGNAAHQTHESDHNAWVGPASDGKMIVTARDFTHDPAHGADADALAEALRVSKDKRLKYVIRAGRIWSLARNGEGWRPYAGPNPHKTHVHVSVSPIEPLYDNTDKWSIGATTPTEGGLSMSDVSDILEAIRKLDSSIYATPRYQALQRSIDAVGAAVQAIIPHLTSEDAKNDEALSKAVADLKAAIEAPEPADAT